MSRLGLLLATIYSSLFFISAGLCRLFGSKEMGWHLLSGGCIVFIFVVTSGSLLKLFSKAKHPV
jgi:hypothetical protein